MKWWLWLIIIVVLLWWFFSSTVKSWRKKIRKEYISFIRESHPEIEIIAEKANSVIIKFGNSEEIEGLFDNIYNACSGTDSFEARKPIYEKFLNGLKEIPKKDEVITLETHGAKIMPRLTPKTILDELRKLGEVPHRPFADTGLIITYVIDYPNSVVYLTNKHLIQLGLDEDSLHKLAMANIAKTFTDVVVKNVLEKQNVNMIKSMDSHDAARVLLLPGYLPEGAEIVALIPDRDTLAIAPVPVDGDWSKLKKLAQAASGRPLFKKPIIVSRNGFKTIQ